LSIDVKFEISSIINFMSSLSFKESKELNISEEYKGSLLRAHLIYFLQQGHSMYER